MVNLTRISIDPFWCAVSAGAQPDTCQSYPGASGPRVKSTGLSECRRTDILGAYFLNSSPSLGGRGALFSQMVSQQHFASPPPPFSIICQVQKYENAHRFALSAIRGERGERGRNRTKTWTKKNGPKVNRLIYRDLQIISRAKILNG